MSVFTNAAATSSPEQARAYTAAIVDLLGSKEPMEVLRATPGGLRRAFAGLTDAQLSAPEAAGKWSMQQVIRHLADSEIVWGYRLRIVLGQDRPTLTGYDQDQWARRLHYEHVPSIESLDEFEIVRRSNVRLLERASPEDLKRVGLHAERGEESVAHMIRLCAGHDLLHLRQIDRIRSRIV